MSKTDKPRLNRPDWLEHDAMSQQIDASYRKFLKAIGKPTYGQRITFWRDKLLQEICGCSKCRERKAGR